MQQEYKEGENFNKADFTTTPLKKGEYENCTFMNCDFSKSGLSGVKLVECWFENCNLSMLNMAILANIFLVE